MSLKHFMVKTAAAMIATLLLTLVAVGCGGDRMQREYSAWLNGGEVVYVAGLLRSDKPSALL